MSVEKPTSCAACTAMKMRARMVTKYKGTLVWNECTLAKRPVAIKHSVQRPKWCPLDQDWKRKEP